MHNKCLIWWKLSRGQEGVYIKFGSKPGLQKVLTGPSNLFT